MGATTVRASTTVGPSTANGSSAVKPATTSRWATEASAADCTTANGTSTAHHARTPSKAGPSSEAGSTSEPRPAVEAGSSNPPVAKIPMRVEAVEPKVRGEPRAGADEQATGEPISPVVAIRCAGIWSIRVITVGADRRTGKISRAAYSNANHYSLSVCVRCAGQRNAEHRENSEVSHIRSLPEEPFGSMLLFVARNFSLALGGSKGNARAKVFLRLPLM